MSPITGVIMNWKRPANVARILSTWRSSRLIDEAIVWNNNPDVSFEHHWARVMNASDDMGLYSRFAAMCLAKHDCVLLQDDDLDAPVASLAKLYEAWRNESDILHGVFGRAPKPNGAYAQDVLGDTESPIVLTRILMAQRKHAARFFLAEPIFAELQQFGRPAGNGEDIIFSYVVQHFSGRLNRVHDVPITELPAPHSIHRRHRKTHLRHRTRLLRACEKWLRTSRRSENEQRAFSFKK